MSGMTRYSNLRSSDVICAKTSRFAREGDESYIAIYIYGMALLMWGETLL